MNTSRRTILKYGAAFSATAFMPGNKLFAQTGPVKGGVLVIAQYPEPSILTAALGGGGATNNISPKIFDGLLTYDNALKPVPQLAESWEVSEDGLTITFRLRSNAKWHDGTPFSSADVAFSLMEVWKKFNSRGKQIFTDVTEVQSPDEVTSVWKLSKPAPYILNGLTSHLAQMVPKHLYEGTDIMKSQYNTAPVGNGPFKLVEWNRGNYMRLARNEDYWDQGKPYVDEVFFRFLPDAASRVAGIEAEEVLLIGESGVPGSDLARLSRMPNLRLETKGYNYVAQNTFFLFNLDRPVFQDVRVRQAIAHAIDQKFLIDNIWYSYGEAATGPFPSDMGDFYTSDVPTYPFDPEKAKALLDEAGKTAGADGIRFEFTHDFLPYGEQYPRTAEYIRDALAKVGIKMTIRSQDYASYLKRIYTDRDFDTINYLIAVGPDPVIGTSRLYHTNAFQPGVAFSNGAHYSNPEADALLDAAASELDAAKRQKLYFDFQRIVQTDLPQIPLVVPKQVTIVNNRVRGDAENSEGIKAGFAGVYIQQ
jgi:peptide/nickel transport system substrate-binding protein